MKLVKLDLTGLAKALLNRDPPPAAGGDSVIVKIVVQFLPLRR